MFVHMAQFQICNLFWLVNTPIKMKSLNQIFNIKSELPDYEVRRINMYNRFGIISFCLLLVFPILGLYFNIIPFLYLSLLAAFSILFPVYLNYVGNPILSRFLGVILSHTTFYLGVILFGFNAGFHLGLIAVIILPILYFENGMLRHVTYSIVLLEGLILYLCFKSLIPIYPIEETQSIFYIILYCMVIVMNLLYFLSFDFLSHYLIQKSDRLLDELKRRNEELKDFSFTTSHDIKQPLRTISSFSALLKRSSQDKLDKKELEYLAFIEQGSKRLNDVLNAILDHSVLGENYQIEKFDSSQLVDNVLIDLNKLVSENNAQIKVSALPEIRASKEKLYIVFQNLLANAIKFRNQFRPCEIKISSNDVGDFWQFDISDNGVGIEEDILPDIFKIFKKGHTDSRIEGRGIGLANCKKIILMHGGSIWVNSELGNGSTFSFTIKK